MTASDSAPQSASEQLSQAELLVAPWRAAWPLALAAWGPTTRLAAPVFHTSPPEPGVGSFAWFDGGTLQVHIDLTWIAREGLHDHAVAILAHEIGHHVMAPADARTRVIVAHRIRLGLIDVPALVPTLANIWHDLLINDRLQRTGTAHLAPVWQRLRANGHASDPLMRLLMRTNEVLWELPVGSLTGGGDPTDYGHAGEGGTIADLETYAQLAARVVRAYRRDVIGGAGGFAALVRTYLGAQITDYQPEQAAGTCTDITATSGLPQGLASDPTLMGDPVHPLLDPVVMQGLAPALEAADSQTSEAPTQAGTSATSLPAHGSYGSGLDGATPADLHATLTAMGEQISLEQVAAAWYRELAAPLLVRFPVRESPVSQETVLGGLGTWDVGEDLSLIDWSATVTASPVVVPGITTRQREVHLIEPLRGAARPVDLDLYVDSSGSMPDGRKSLAPITLAGVVLALSALRAGASVQVTVWSGPADVASTHGFTRDAHVILVGLMAFFGRGTQFPLHLLRNTFLADTARARAGRKPTHVAVISDSGISTMFPPEGADAGLAAQALEAAGGGGSLILNIDPAWQHLPETGDYDVYLVREQADLVPFARDFARRWWGGRS